MLLAVSASTQYSNVFLPWLHVVVLKQRTWIYEFKSLMLIRFNVMVVNVLCMLKLVSLCMGLSFLRLCFMITFIGWPSSCQLYVLLSFWFVCPILMYLFIVNIPVFVFFSLFYYPFNCPIFFTEFCLCMSLLLYSHIFLCHLSVFGSCVWNLRNFPHPTWFLFLLLFVLFSA